MLKKLSRAALGAAVPHEKGTAHMATVQIPLPDKIVLCMQQHIGAPAVPVVKKGDDVDVGTLVGKAGGFVSADIHSGVSGTVTGIETVRYVTGRNVQAVVIQPDGQQTLDASVKPPVVEDYAGFIKAVQNCGLVGLGGAGFPTAVKLSPKDVSAIDTLVINGAECEPYLTADNREFLECADTVAEGIRAVMKYLEIPRCLIGIERNKPEAMDRMFTVFQSEPNVTVVPLPSRYPQGAEKVLIEKTTGREVPRGGLPSDVGVIVMNVTTVSTLGKYLRTGMPLVTKRLTVEGDAVAKPANVEAIIGTPLRHILDFCGTKAEPAKVVTGGPMMGTAQLSLDFPVLKQNNGLLVLSEKAAHLPAVQPCIRCGRCISACPMGLSPVEIAGAYNRGDVEALDAMMVDLCMACGTCSFVCPAKRPVAQTMALAKDTLKRKGGKK